MLKRLWWLVLLSIIAAGAVYVGWHSLQQAKLQLDAPLYTVPAGSTAMQLCQRWQQQGRLTKSECLLLRVYLKLNPDAALVQQGVYRITNEQSLLEVLALFRSGREAQALVVSRIDRISGSPGGCVLSVRPGLVDMVWSGVP